MPTERDLYGPLRAHEIYIAEIAVPTRSEGPGCREAIWFQGCVTACEGCCNPEMQDIGEGVVWLLMEFARCLEFEAERGRIEGITLLGGEPFLQAAGAADIAQTAQKLGLGVLTFTGYDYDELSKSNRPSVSRLLAATDLLIDGPFLAAQKSARRRWIGSENQRMHYLSERYRNHPDILSDYTQSVDVRLDNESVTVAGWPDLVGGVDGQS